MNLTLKVDVDTYEGMKKGVPNLLNLFRELNIKASFYIPFGPDQSGRAIFRVFKKRGFMKKMVKTSALKIYGLKTVLRGTLLPSIMIGSSFPEIARSIPKEGHELGIHGYNHVLWQDHLREMTVLEVKEEMERALFSFEKCLGKKPESFAAPAWLCTPTSLGFIDAFKFSYASDTRAGTYPFYPTMEGIEFKTLQIPSTLPTLDELLGLEPVGEDLIHSKLTKEMEDHPLPFHVHTIHAELEGMFFLNSFAHWLRYLKHKDYKFLTCAEIKETVLKDPQKIPRSKVILKEIPGRAGAVACQQS